jgi:allophanate hydrolase subunit 2
MGIRLDGEKLTHNDLGAEIVSDGVAPGSIQVPANGQPIVLIHYIAENKPWNSKQCVSQSIELLCAFWWAANSSALHQ